MREDVENIAPEIKSLVERLKEFYEPWEAYAYLAMPHPSLNGFTAVQLIQEGRTSEVEQVLAQLEDGVYL